MIKRSRSFALTILTVLTFLTPALVPAVASAAGCSTTASSVGQGVNFATGTTNSNCSSANVSSSSVGGIAKNIVSLFSVVVGAVSILMIIYGGFRYITSGGDSGKVGNAKNTLIYAVVGLVIVALAQLIVHFVLNQTTTLGS